MLNTKTRSIGLSFLLAIAHFGCGDDKGFKGSVVQGPPGAIPPEAVVEEFNIKGGSSQLDIVWVIDNSGSMTDEAAQVRSNFSKFIKSVSDETDLKLALISSSVRTGQYGDTSVRLSPRDLAEGHSQLDLHVGSTNAMTIAAAATCPAEATNLFVQRSNRFGGNLQDGSKLCGSDEFFYSDNFLNRYPTDNRYIEEPEIVRQAAGTLSNFFRENSTRAYVFVTDDNAETVNQHNMMKMMAGASKPIIYAFRGDSKSQGCKIANKGVAYEELASSTGGKVFDICESDWSQHFSTLTESVVNQANNRFTLKHAAIPTSITVSIDGKKLAATDFELSDKSVIIKEAVMPEGSAAIQVSYEYDKD